MEWLCTICETINNNYYNKKIPENELEYIRIKKFCKNCFHARDNDNWDTHIEMNGLIDKYLPRHQMDILLSY